MARHANDPNAGLALHGSVEKYKMFVCDTGLFITLAFWDNAYTDNIIYQKLLSDKLRSDLGYVFENMVAQMLKAAGNELYYHTWPTGKGIQVSCFFGHIQGEVFFANRPKLLDLHQGFEERW